MYLFVFYSIIYKKSKVHKPLSASMRRNLLIFQQVFFFFTNFVP